MARHAATGRQPRNGEVAVNRQLAVNRQASPPPPDPDAVIYWGVDEASLSPGRKQLDSDLFIDLKAAGIFQLFDAAYILAHEVEAVALRNIVKRAHDCTAHGTIVFTADRGFQGNGSTGYLDTHYNLFNDRVNYDLNTGSMGIYCRTNVGANSTTSIGAQLTGGNPRSYQNIRSVAGTWAYSINSGSGGTIAVPSSLGLFVAQRTASNSLIAYRNGSAIASSSVASTSIPGGNATISARNNVGVGIDSFSPRQYAFPLFGGLLSAGQHLTLYTLLQAYLTAIGAAV